MPEWDIKLVKKQLTYEEFKEKYMKPNKFFDFSRFEIKCLKCGSKNIEFGGELQINRDDCWYEEERGTAEAKLVCKCHDCGNATVMEVDDCTSSVVSMPIPVEKVCL